MRAAAPGTMEPATHRKPRTCSSSDRARIWPTRDLLRRRVRFALWLPAPAAGGRRAPGARAADPTTADCLSASEASLKLRSAHKLREARAQLLVCAAQTCPTDVRNECASRVSELNAAIPTVVFEAKDSAGNDLTDVKVAMDAQPLVDRLDGASISLDPGPHTFTFTASAQRPVEKMFVIQEGEKDRHVRVVIGAAEQAAVSSPPAATPSSASPGAPPPVSAPPALVSSPAAAPDVGGSSWSTQKTIGLVVGGVGVVGAVVGTVFGLVASHDWSQAQSECASPTSCPNHAASVSDHDATVTAGTVSTVAFIAGGAAIAAGAVLFFTAPHDAEQRPAVSVHIAPAWSPGHGGVLMEGAF